MMLFSLVKKDFLIVKKFFLLILMGAVIIPPFMLWQVPELTSVLGFIFSVVFAVFMLLQYVSIKEHQFPKAATLLCATPFPRKMMVLSKYIFCVVIYMIGSGIFWIETFIIPGLGKLSIKMFTFMFLATSVFISIYFPVQYKFGFEKTNYIFGVLVITSPMYLPKLMSAGSLNLGFLTTLSPYLVYIGSILISFAVLSISAVLSIKIYEKSDLV